MPTRSEFFKRADFGRTRVGIGCFARIAYNAPRQIERTSQLVVPHELPSEFLLGVRRKDRPLALAYLDQPALLRSVRAAFRQTTIAATSVNGDHDLNRGRVAWTRMQARTPTTRHSSSDQCAGAEFAGSCSTNHRRTNLHLRREDEERYTLLTPRTWTSPLLATQRRRRDAAAGEVAN